MRRILASLAIICMFCQCSPCRHCPAVNTPAAWQEDSIRVEYRERLVHDTVEFTPPEFYVSQVSKDTVSVIENDYAKTTAVWHDGLLSHDLQSKPIVIRVPVVTVEHDTLIFQEKGRAETVVKEVVKEKSPTPFERVRLKSFWILLLLCLIGFRREIYALFVKIKPILGVLMRKR